MQLAALQSLVQVSRQPVSFPNIQASQYLLVQALPLHVFSAAALHDPSHELPVHWSLQFLKTWDWQLLQLPATLSQGSLHFSGMVALHRS